MNDIVNISIYSEDNDVLKAAESLNELGFEFEVASEKPFGFTGEEAEVFIALSMMAGVIGNSASSLIFSSLKRLSQNIYMASRSGVPIKVIVNGVQFNVKTIEDADRLYNELTTQIGELK